MNNTEKSEAVRQSSVKSKPESKIWKFLKLLHKKTVYFIGKITVKIDSRGIYSLENINYHDAYLNIPVRMSLDQPHLLHFSFDPLVDLSSRRTERESEIQLHHSHLSQSNLYRDRIHIS